MFITPRICAALTDENVAGDARVETCVPRTRGKLLVLRYKTGSADRIDTGAGHKQRRPDSLRSAG